MAETVVPSTVVREDIADQVRERAAAVVVPVWDRVAVAAAVAAADGEGKDKADK